MMVRIAFFLVILLFPIADLTMAYLYNVTGLQEVILLRYYRDTATVVLAFIGFQSIYLPYRMRLACLFYGALLIIYSVISLVTHVVTPLVLIASLGTLLIPFTMTLAGFAAIRTERQMYLLLLILILYAIATTMFGFWEIKNTLFWIYVVDIGQYLWDIKGITTGFQKEMFLPWNFSGLDYERRAAGLLAAPLAQGFFLAVLGLVAFAFLRGRSLIMATLVTLFCLYGCLMTETRGALLAYAMGAMVYFTLPSRENRYVVNLIILAVMIAMLGTVAYKLIDYSVTLRDHSTIGHLNALKKNLSSIANVTLVGDGVGAAGGQASSVGLDIEGGGEGALFSIIYQLGIPGALAFLWYYWRMFMQVYSFRRAEGMTGELARCLIGLFVGVVPTMFSSEHILTYSGMGAFWFTVGSFLGYTTRQHLLIHTAMPEDELPDVTFEPIRSL